MIDYTVLFICSGLFLSAFTLSFAIVSQFVDHTFFLNQQYTKPDKFEYYYNNNYIDYSEAVDASNNDYVNGMYEEETPVGKVIMTYNDDSGTFMYYCDRYIPNKMLEVVCRGFVLKYECYHILVDYAEEGMKRYDVLKRFIEEDKKLENEKAAEKQKDDDLFANMKPYNKKKSENSNNPTDILIKTNFNKFKNCGRIENYVAKDDTPKDNPDDQVKVLSFMDFKNKIKSHT